MTATPPSEVLNFEYGHPDLYSDDSTSMLAGSELTTGSDFSQASLDESHQLDSLPIGTEYTFPGSSPEVATQDPSSAGSALTVSAPESTESRQRTRSKKRTRDENGGQAATSTVTKYRRNRKKLEDVWNGTEDTLLSADITTLDAFQRNWREKIIRKPRDARYRDKIKRNKEENATCLHEVADKIGEQDSKLSKLQSENETLRYSNSELAAEKTKLESEVARHAKEKKIWQKTLSQIYDDQKKLYDKLHACTRIVTSSSVQQSSSPQSLVGSGQSSINIEITANTGTSDFDFANLMPWHPMKTPSIPAEPRQDNFSSIASAETLCPTPHSATEETLLGGENAHARATEVADFEAFAALSSGGGLVSDSLPSGLFHVGSPTYGASFWDLAASLADSNDNVDPAASVLSGGQSTSDEQF
ncbi:hypothetical protein IAU59_002577 [Kwoniella sp. CBS 9459]